jgi:epsilon-lactone hydrolase
MKQSHPAVEAVITKVRSVYGRWRRDTPVAQMRADWDALFCAKGQADVDEAMADGVRCQWISAPGARPDRVVMYFHGGGFQVGSLSSHQELMAEISAAAGARVLGVDYRLAPEHIYPAAHDDAWTAYRWLMAQGVSAHQVALAGDSAGGGLALSLLLRLKSQAEAMPAAAWAMSAWTDLTASGSSYQTRSTLDPIHQRPMILAMARNYLGEVGDPSDVRLSPLLASMNQLEGLPPLLLQVGERETVVSDSEDFVDKARRAGVAAEVQVWPGMIHVFQQFPADLEDARHAIESGAQFLAAQFDAATHRKTQK